MATLAAAHVLQVLSSYRQRVMNQVPKQQPQARRAVRVEQVPPEEEPQLWQAQESGLGQAFFGTLFCRDATFPRQPLAPRRRARRLSHHQACALWRLAASACMNAGMRLWRALRGVETPDAHAGIQTQQHKQAQVQEKCRCLDCHSVGASYCRGWTWGGRDT